jgi:hypothetical protein
MTSIACAGQYIAGLLKLKENGKGTALTNIIAFDEVESELKEKAEQ